MAGGQINFSAVGSSSSFKVNTYSTTNLNNKINLRDMDYEEIDYSNADISNTSIILENYVSMEQMNYDLQREALVATGATIAVGITSVLSGVLKLAERLDDALNWLSGIIVSGVARLFGNDKFAVNYEKQTMDYIARDQVAELNDLFYNDTSLGKAINDASVMKYDSNLAQGIQNVTDDAILIVGATAATVASGGAASPALLAAIGAAGFVSGAGETAEKKFQDTDNRGFWKDSLEIGVDGGIKALSTISFAKAGATAITGVKTLKSLFGNGIKSIIKETLHVFDKEIIKSTIKNKGKDIAKSTFLETLIDSDTITETSSVLLDNVKTAVVNKKIQGDNVTSALCDIMFVFGSNYFGNLIGNVAFDSVKKMDRIIELYEDGQRAAIEDYNVGFKSYREHAEKHVYFVTTYMQNLSKDVDGINVDETLFGALAHDLGMKGGYVKVDGKFVLADSLLDEIDNPTFGNIADYVRKPHPLNSALTVLTDDIVPSSVDKDVVALLAMSHSKSTSGITNFDNPDQWKACIEDLDKALKQYNIDNNTNFKLDTDKLLGMIDNKDEFTRLQKEALIIRDGDAMSQVYTVDGNTYMQTGQVSEIVNNTPRDSFDTPVGTEEEEIAGMTDMLKTLDGKDVEGGDVSSGVKYHAGELNVSFSSKTDGASYYRATVDLVDSNQTPHSTMFAIQERIGEVNTYTNCESREFVINLPKEAKGTELGNWYEKQLDDYLEFLITGVDKNTGKVKRNVGIECLLNDGKISKETYEQQFSFYDKGVKIEWV